MAFNYASLIVRGRKYKLYSKREIRTEKWQKILEFDYKKKRIKDEKIKKEINKFNSTYKGRIVRCLDCNAIMYTAYRESEGYYYLVSKKGNKGNHNWDCLFFDEFNENIYDKEGKVILPSANVFFKEYKDISIPEPNTKLTYIRKEDEKTLREITRFSRLIRDIIDQAYAAAFNYLNKSKDRINEKLEPLSMDFFINILQRQINETKIKQSGKNKNNKLTIEKYAEDNGFVIKIGVLDYFNKTNNSSWVEYSDINENFIRKVPLNIWEYGSLATKNYGEVIDPPYLYVKIYRKEDNHIYRFYTFPVADSKYFIPVESSLEKEYLAELLSYNKSLVVYKPLTYFFLKRVLTSKIYENLTISLDFPNILTADIFIFSDGKIELVEVIHNSKTKYKGEKLYIESKLSKYKKLPPQFKAKIVFYNHKSKSISSIKT